MATEEHLVLSSLIKGVHHDLRKRSRVLGSDTAWTEHCNKQEILKKYAAAMHKLATQHWENDGNDKINSRIEWVVKECQNYFFEGGLEKINSKEQSKLERIISFVESSNEFLPSGEVCPIVDFKKPLLMIDVGSCYNPFKKYSIFTPVPIDLAPATGDVFTCDFLGVKVVKNESHGDDEIIKEIVSNINFDSGSKKLQNIQNLPAESFDVVIFSLFLEYLPSSNLRYASCQKAFDLLKPCGLLFIITPDSKHQTANAPIMRNWRISLEIIGFTRISYEKLTHLHCMAFRKCPHMALPKILAMRELSISEKHAKMQPAEMMIIPQDLYVEFDEVDDALCVSQETVNFDDVSYFSELPFSF